MPSKVFGLDTRMWPVVCVTVRGEMQDPDLDYLFGEFDRVHARREKFCLIIDALKGEAPSSRIRQRIGTWTKKNAHYSQIFCAGSAVVYSSKVLVGALQALNWMARPAYPQRPFSNRADAIAWVIGRVREEGMRHSAASLTPEALEACFSARAGAA